MLVQGGQESYILERKSALWEIEVQSNSVKLKGENQIDSI